MIGAPSQTHAVQPRHAGGGVSGTGLAPARLGSAASASRVYRLIDRFQQPHAQLDGLYDSFEEALRDAIRWLEALGPAAAVTAIGLEVSTRSGDWRTIRHPDLLLCPLPGLA